MGEIYCCYIYRHTDTLAQRILFRREWTSACQRRMPKPEAHDFVRACMKHMEEISSYIDAHMSQYVD